MFRFQYIEYLWALAAIPVLVALYYQVLSWKRRTRKKIGDDQLVNEMTKNYSPRRFAQKFLWIVVAFLMTVFALANLRSPKGTERVTRNGIDVFIALDVSRSMLARDIRPFRLERAKQMLEKLIDRLGNDRVGIVVFAGRAYLQMPLTGDPGAAKMYLSAASPEGVPTQGTVIAEALQLCAASFDTREKKYKSVVLVSDGEDHDENAIRTASQMAEEGIVINTVGIGSPEGSVIVDETTNEVKKDKNGNTVITKLNEDELRSIAAKGNGLYQFFTNADDVVSKLEAQLSSMDSRKITDDSLVSYRDHFQWFLLAALLILVIEMLFSERTGNPEKRSDRKPAALLFMGLCIIPFSSIAQNGKSIIRKGNESYEKGEFDKAAALYRDAAGENPYDATAQYNLGNALFRLSKPDDALSAYDKALTNAGSKVDREAAFYNKGVVLQNSRKLSECIDAYKNALKLDPADEDARQNLQKALEQQKQQKQKEKKDQEQKKPKEKEKQEKQKPKDEEKNDQPRPQPSKLTRQDAEEKLKALLQQEKNLQDKLKKMNTASPTQPEKDW